MGNKKQKADVRYLIARLKELGLDTPVAFNEREEEALREKGLSYVRVRVTYVHKSLFSYEHPGKA